MNSLRSEVKKDTLQHVWYIDLPYGYMSWNILGFDWTVLGTVWYRSRIHGNLRRVVHSGSA